MISTERHSQHQAMEELQDFKLADLFAKLQLDDDEFHEWLADIGLLHGSRTCTCGNLIKRHRAGSGSIHWRCNRAMHLGQRDMVVYNFWSQVAAIFPCQP